MYMSTTNSGPLEKADVQKGDDGRFTIWVRGESHIALTVDEARWLADALQKCLAAIPAAADVNQGEIFGVRSPSHWRGEGTDFPAPPTGNDPADPPEDEGPAF
jgi:hypothetical protein